MSEGDIFLLNVLNQTLTYQVDQVKIVLPHETEDLLIKEGEDYCTLVTCTPYGINTHRLLVRGHRIANAQGDANVVADALQIEPNYVAVFVAVPILILLFIAAMILTGKHSRRKKAENEQQEKAENEDAF
jgi:sortase A